MKLEQTTMFGVRGERYRIKKTSRLAKLAVGEKVDFHLRIGGDVTSSGHTVTEVWPRPNKFGCDVARISGVSGWVAQAALTRTPADGRSGAGLLDLALWTAALLLLAVIVMGELRNRMITRERVYPAPVCERCGQVLDGTSADCAEERP